MEQAHGLPLARKQARFTKSDGRRGRRDRYYEVVFGLIIELDGKRYHPAERRHLDQARDNDATATGGSTLRYGWDDVTLVLCDVAAQVHAALVKRKVHRAAQALLALVQCAPPGRLTESARRAPPTRMTEADPVTFPPGRTISRDSPPPEVSPRWRRAAEHDLVPGGDGGSPALGVLLGRRTRAGRRVLGGFGLLGRCGGGLGFLPGSGTGFAEASSCAAAAAAAGTAGALVAAGVAVGALTGSVDATPPASAAVSASG